MRHFANAHFPGLYSIGLEKTQYSFTRMYLAKPGELHEDLMYDNDNFLWHNHAYDFIQTPVLGSVIDIHLKIGSQERFNCYKFNGGMTSGKKPELEFVSKVLVDIYDYKIYNRGEDLNLKKDVIHRVLFRPDERTGWFASVVTEFNHSAKSPYVYSKNLLTEVPNADILYREIPQTEAQELIDSVFPGVRIGVRPL